MDMIKIVDNPIGKSRKRRKAKASTKRRRRTTRKATTTRRKRRKATAAPKRRRRRRTVSGSNIVTTQKPKTTMGRKRRTYRRKSVMGKATTRRRRRSKRSLFGQGLSFNEITSDLLSILSISGGFIGGNFLQGLILPKIVEKPTVMHGLVSSAGVYGLGYALDYFLKPKGGAMSNAILGLKIGGIVNLAVLGIALLMGKTTLESGLSGLSATAGYMDMITKQSPLLGASYLVDESGDILPLGKGNIIGSSDDMALSRLDNQIDSLMGSPIMNFNRKIS